MWSRRGSQLSGWVQLPEPHRGRALEVALRTEELILLKKLLPPRAVEQPPQTGGAQGAKHGQSAVTTCELGG